MNKEAAEVKEALEKADMVLVGIGEEFEENEYLMQNSVYRQICEKVAAEKILWVMPYVNAIFLRDDKRLQKAYRSLGGMLADKNYFVISVCTNGFLSKAGLREERLVEPCGSYEKMQCVNGCEGSVAPVCETLLEEVEACCRGTKGWKELNRPVCSACKAPYVFNSLYTERYLEEGYSERWKLYTKWLQGTVNRKLCILELGAGMMFSGVTRFRFEKIAGLNQKAKLIRVHRHLYQLPEEIAARGIGISKNSVEFMAEKEKS